MGLGTVVSLKDLTNPPVPILLCAFTFQNGEQLLCCTHPLNPTEGGIAFPGTATMPAGNYLALVTQQTLRALQQRSPEGIDRVGTVKITLANANQLVWSNYEQSPGPGFRGATLQMAIVMWQVGTSSFSSDSPVRFTGTCDMAVPIHGGTLIAVSATNSHNMGTVMLPSVPIQPRCPHTFPETPLQRILGASDPSSTWYGCGYNPDQIALIVFAGGGGSGVNYTATVSGGAVTAITLVSGGSGYTTAPTATVYGSTTQDPARVTCTVSGGVVTATLAYGGSGYGVDPEDFGDIRRGNLNAGVPFTSCPYLRSGGDGGCMARLGNSATITVAPDGDLMHDTTGRHTGRFAGVEWNPPQYYSYQRSYEQQKGLPSFSYLNQSVYSQYVPEVYGTQWISPPIANVIEDGNSVRFECILTRGYIGQSPAFNTQQGTIQQVIVNGEIVPLFSAQSVYLYDFWSVDPLFSWYWVTPGTRNGNANQLPGYANPGHSALGDPYGGMAVIVVVIYRDLYSGNSGVPNVQVLLGGRQIAVFTAPNAYTMEYSSNPAWVLLDLLVRANWIYSEVNMASFIAAAAFCDNVINYTNATGTTSSHAQFIAEMAVVQRASASEILAGLLRSFNAYLTWDDNGLLVLNINQTLADQQGSPVAGSNYNTAVPSVTYAGVAANGYVAYSFDESNVNLLQPSSVSQQFDIEGVPQPNLQTPNQIFIQFQDRDNQYQSDSLGDVDSAAVARSGGGAGAQLGGAVVPQTLQVRGISSFDQAIRISNTYIGERQYGNEADDARGTRAFTIGTTVKAEALRLGHLVFLSWQQLGISNQLFRVTSIAPGPNWETAKIGLAWHQDQWYTTAYGQSAAQYQNQVPIGGRAPRPWQPFTEAPVSSLFVASDYKFGIGQSYTTLAGGTALATLTLTGRLPVNSVSTVKAPLVQVQGTTATTGGTLNGGISYQIVLCALDSTGGISAPSKPINVVVPTGTTTNTIGTGLIYWQPGTVGYVIFAGADTYHVTYQGTATGTPSSLTLTSLPNFYAFAPPDKSFSRFLIQSKVEIHAGVLGTTVASVSTNTIVLSGATLTNNFAGTDVSVLATIGAATQKVLDFRINSNSGNTLTLATDPTGLVNVGDVVVVRTKATTVSSTTIGDVNFVNAITNAGAGLVVNGEVGNQVLIWAGPGIGQTRRIVSNTSTVLTLDSAWDPNATPTSASTFVIVTPAWTYSSETAPMISSVPDPASPSTIATINVTNYDGQSLIVGVVAEDPTGGLGTQFLMPMREIYITGNAGTAPSAPPANVSSLGPVKLTTAPLGSQGQAMVQVDCPYVAPSPLGTFTQVYAYLAAPDDAANDLTTTLLAGGTIVASDSTQYNVATALTASSAVLVDTVAYDPQQQNIRFTFPMPGQQQTWRLYADSGSATVKNALVRADQAGATPNVAFAVNPTTIIEGTSGAEYAPNALNLQPIAGSPFYTRDAGGQTAWQFGLTWGNATTDPMYNKLAGYQVVVQGPTGLLSLAATVRPTGNVNGAQYPEFISQPIPIPSQGAAGTAVYTVYLVSEDFNGNSNSLNSATPSLEFSVSFQGGSAGQEYTSLVADFAVEEVGYVLNGSGQTVLRFIATWFPPYVAGGNVIASQNPVDPTWGGIRINAITPSFASPGNALTGVGHFTPDVAVPGRYTTTIDISAFPASSSTWKFWAQSVDTNGRSNSYQSGISPEADLTVGPPPVGSAGTEYAPVVTGVTWS